MTGEYDEVGDILYLDLGDPGAQQVMVEVAPGAMLRKEGSPGMVQGIEIHGLRRRTAGNNGITVPVGIELRELEPTPG